MTELSYLTLRHSATCPAILASASLLSQLTRLHLKFDSYSNLSDGSTASTDSFTTLRRLVLNINDPSDAVQALQQVSTHNIRRLSVIWDKSEAESSRLCGIGPIFSGLSIAGLQNLRRLDIRIARDIQQQIVPLDIQQLELLGSLSDLEVLQLPGGLLREVDLFAQLVERTPGWGSRLSELIVPRYFSSMADFYALGTGCKKLSTVTIGVDWKRIPAPALPGHVLTAPHDRILYLNISEEFQALMGDNVIRLASGLRAIWDQVDIWFDDCRYRANALGGMWFDSSDEPVINRNGCA
ncbi:hypothetical protein RhiJN_25805 [Ceratobasidium sp. AG-Ba]|nr:hypothetical protein RhiJN_25805 [Ceratobasidium sp. AG-Ba]